MKESGFQPDNGWHEGLWWGLASEAGDQRVGREGNEKDLKGLPLGLERQAICQGLQEP